MFITEDYFAEDFIEEGYAVTHIGEKVEKFDITNKLIYLKRGTTSYHPVDNIYKEMRFFRRVDITLRGVDFPVEARGNIFKGTDDLGAEHYTARLAIFKHGWKIVPYDEEHTLIVTGEQISDIGESGAQIMNITSITNKVIIEYFPPDTEIIYIEKNTGLNPGDLDSITESVWDHPISSITATDSIGNFITTKLLSIKKFIGLS